VRTGEYQELCTLLTTVRTDEMAPFWVPLDAIPYDRMVSPLPN
jgi:hypothetical protein